MIDVQAVLRDMPHFETFCSVDKLHRLVDELRADSRFEVRTVGSSANGVPIHCVRFGTGRTKAMIVGTPHCMEPIGSMTVFSLMTLLRARNLSLVAADVEWHIVPCIDPDGALLNEGWTQQPFSFDNYKRNYYVQPSCGQVDMSFPISHKKMMWDKPSHEAKILKDLIDQILPEFYFSLHNTRMSGLFCYISHDIGSQYYRQLQRLLEQQRFPIQKKPMWNEVFQQFGEGVLESVTMKKYYNYFEKVTPNPEKNNALQSGMSSWEYLSEVKPDALSFIAEMGYVLHPSEQSSKQTGQNLRQFKLRLDADGKYLATVLLDEWEKVKGQLDAANPLYRSVAEGWVLPERDRLLEGGTPVSRYPTREILFNPVYDKPMTEADRFNACMVDGGFHNQLYQYQFVSLLRASPQTQAVKQALRRLEQVFSDAQAELERYIDFGAFKVFDCDTLAKVQLGSGLIALNAVVDARSGRVPTTAAV